MGEGRGKRPEGWRGGDLRRKNIIGMRRVGRFWKIQTEGGGEGRFIKLTNWL